jgi:hypothetical protein
MKFKLIALWTITVALILGGCALVPARDKGELVPTPTPQAPAYGEAQSLVERAIADLQAQLGVSEQDVTVGQVVETEFPDASLGVPEPGKMYAQVITPGYVIQLTVNGESYEYHGAGDRVVLAPEGQNPPATKPGMPPLDDQVSAYHRLEIPDAGLSVEVPAGWFRLEPELAWTPEQDSGLRLGLNWADLQPPMEAEAVLLPNHSQIVSSDAIELSWGHGRAFTLEVYAPAAQGGDTRAPVEAVETHVLVVTNVDNVRRAFDLYASAPDAEQLAALAPTLQHLVESATLISPAQGSSLAVSG